MPVSCHCQVFLDGVEISDGFRFWDIVDFFILFHIFLCLFAKRALCHVGALVGWLPHARPAQDHGFRAGFAGVRSPQKPSGQHPLIVGPREVRLGND